MPTEFQEALSLMHEARKLLFQRLHEPGGFNGKVTQSLDKLAQAFEFVENFDEKLALPQLPLA